MISIDSAISFFKKEKLATSFNLLFALIGLWGLALIFKGHPWGMNVHGAMIFAFMIITIVGSLFYWGKWGHKDGYNFEIVRLGIYVILFWAIVAMLAGVYIAFQMWLPVLNFDLPAINFGRLRAIHTSAAVFAFAGNVLIVTSFYVVQRTCNTRLAGGFLPWFVVWGYQLFIILAASGYLMGITQSKEYAEPEWYLDIWLTIVWVCYLYVFVATLLKRNQSHIYVANWFYLAFIATIALLHVMNNLAMPISIWDAKSYIVFSGVQDAMLQWWYGHNAVGFLLTAGFLGLVYYFLPKEANRPIFSYRLSVIHFWGLIFLYMWAGPHHLHYTALPIWVQNIGMTFSLILWMPSWGGAINGIMTLKGAWNLLKTNPALRFTFTGVIYYGLTTFEGPMLSIGPINALAHYTDWIVAHVHLGALGWVSMVSFGGLYYIIRSLWGGRFYSKGLVYLHYWLAFIGLNLYAISMWASGVTQGLMLKASDENGFLIYSFIETLETIKPMHILRTVGGIFFLSGMLVMAYNFVRTALEYKKNYQDGSLHNEISDRSEEKDPNMELLNLNK